MREIQFRVDGNRKKRLHDVFIASSSFVGSSVEQNLFEADYSRRKIGHFPNYPNITFQKIM
jgi:hypothetical protein